MTKKELKEKGYFVYSYDNGDYKYEDENGIEHLFRNGKEITKGEYVFSYDNGDYQYSDKKGIDHLFRDGKEIAKGGWVDSYPNGDYKYEDKNGINHLLREGKELLVCDFIYEIKNGVYECESTTKTTHNFNKGENNMANKETNLTKRIEKYWTEKGSYVLKYHGNNFTQQGVPDLIICYKGTFIAIEVKVNGNLPSEIQKEHIKRIKEWYNGYSEWVNEDNWKEISEKIIDSINFKNREIEIEERRY